MFEFACLFKKSVLNKIQTQNGAQTLYFNLLQNNVLSMKLLYLDVLLHALLTSSTSEKSHVLSILADDVRVKFSLWKHILQQKYYTSISLPPLSKPRREARRLSVDWAMRSSKTSTLLNFGSISRRSSLNSGRPRKN